MTDQVEMFALDTFKCGTMDRTAGGTTVTFVAIELRLQKTREQSVANRKKIGVILTPAVADAFLQGVGNVVVAMHTKNDSREQQRSS